MEREVGRRFKREGIYVYLWLIYVEVQQKTVKFCKAIILQLKSKLIKKKKKKLLQTHPLVIDMAEFKSPSLLKPKFKGAAEICLEFRY